jgi:hypothetical protein
MGLQFFARLRSCATGWGKTAAWLCVCAVVAPCLWATTGAAEQSGENRDDAGRRAVYSARLSVLNGGAPRNDGQARDEVAQSAAAPTDPFAEERPEFDPARWLLGSGQSTGTLARTGALPVVGDFNGDGRSEVGIFIDGQWFIDLNGNGRWDRDDLWASLGSATDQPLVGDWDGDGKDDIGVFGLDRSITNYGEVGDAGLPDAANESPSDAPKSAQGCDKRTVRTSRLGATGALQSAAVDHLLVLAPEVHAAVAGDFNGDGIDTIAIFRDGQWLIDVDGNGTLSPADVELTFGQPGDLPFAGDFDGDGIADIGVYREGTWLIETKLTDGQLGPETVIKLGGRDDLPVVGDWNDDGRDDAGVFHSR